MKSVNDSKIFVVSLAIVLIVYGLAISGLLAGAAPGHPFADDLIIYYTMDSADSVGGYQLNMAVGPASVGPAGNGKEYFLSSDGIDYATGLIGDALCIGNDGTSLDPDDPNSWETRDPEMGDFIDIEPTAEQMLAPFEDVTVSVWFNQIKKTDPLNHVGKWCDPVQAYTFVMGTHYCYLGQIRVYQNAEDPNLPDVLTVAVGQRGTPWAKCALSGCQRYETDPIPIDVCVWHHVAYSFSEADPATGTVKCCIYFDGIEIADANVTAFTDIRLGAHGDALTLLRGATVGAYHEPHAMEGHFFLIPDGMLIDEFSIIKGVLSAEQINEIYTSIAPQPPVADAGENIQIPSADQSYTVIQGTGSDPDEDPLQYCWLEGEQILLDWTDVGPNGEAYLDLATLPYLAIGNHTLTLVVSDGKLTSPFCEPISDEMILTIQNSPPDVQPAPSTQTVEYFVDDIVVIADVADFDGDTLSYEWLKDGVVLDANSVATVQGGDVVPIPDLSILAGDARFPLGVHQIELEVTDGINDPVSVSVSVEVIDTTAPSLSPIPSLTILWPPNHELQPVTIAANAFDKGGGVIHLDVTVQCSEPPDADGDGNTIPDYYIDSVDNETGLIELQLRAERSGKGDGRTYTISITATDESGNQSVAVVEIFAPHDRRKK